MFRKTINPVKQRNSILIMAGIFLIIAIINKPILLLFFISAQRFAGVALTVFAAFLAAREGFLGRIVYTARMGCF